MFSILSEETYECVDLSKYPSDFQDIDRVVSLFDENMPFGNVLKEFVKKNIDFLCEKDNNIHESLDQIEEYLSHAILSFREGLEHLEE